jgi:DnaJ family protein B protein 6
MAPPNTDLYEALGVNRDASPEQIRRAYRRRALECHPDRLPVDASDSQLRDASDQFRSVRPS